MIECFVELTVSLLYLQISLSLFETINTEPVIDAHRFLKDYFNPLSRSVVLVALNVTDFPLQETYVYTKFTWGENDYYQKSTSKSQESNNIIVFGRVSRSPVPLTVHGRILCHLLDML